MRSSANSRISSPSTCVTRSPGLRPASQAASPCSTLPIVGTSSGTPVRKAHT
jgi:hypothetical protein